MRDDVRAGRQEAAGDRGASRAQGGLDCRFGAGHGEERTENMPYMFVTLEVSKLSGWLNTDARQNMEPMSLTLDVSKLSGWLNAPALRNIWYMVVTFEVSKLSGWLNADAP